MIFPDWGTAPDTAPEEALPLFREWAVDWENGCFALRRGEPYLVSGDEALKIWAARALRPESQRFRYTAWSADYGNELTLLLGGCVDQGILESQVRQYVRDALRQENGFHGIAERVAKELSELVGVEARAVVPGHIQRGGSPTVRDRLIATQMGYHAVALLAEGKTNRVICSQAGKMVDLDIVEGLAMKKSLDSQQYEAMEAMTGIGN